MTSKAKPPGTFDHSALGKALPRDDATLDAMTTAAAMQARQEHAAADWQNKMRGTKFQNLLDSKPESVSGE